MNGQNSCPGAFVFQSQQRYSKFAVTNHWPPVLVWKS